MLRNILRHIARPQKIYFWDKDICPVVRADLLGKSVLLLVDSGSDASYLDKDFFIEIGYKGEIKPSKGVVGAQGEDASHGKIMTNIGLGKYKYELPMTIYDLKSRLVYLGSNSEEHPVGIIGADFLQVYNIVLDFKNRVMYEYI